MKTKMHILNRILGNYIEDVCYGADINLVSDPDVDCSHVPALIDSLKKVLRTTSARKLKEGMEEIVMLYDGWRG